jgi:hypothetical protein
MYNDKDTRDALMANKETVYELIELEKQFLPAIGTRAPPWLFMCARLSCGRVPVLSKKREGVLPGLDLKFVPRKRRGSLCAVTPCCMVSENS